MTTALMVVVQIYPVIGFACAVLSVSAQRRLRRTLLADPSPAAEAAMWTLFAFDRLPWWRRAPMRPLAFLVTGAAWPASEVVEGLERRLRRGQLPPPTFRQQRWGGTLEELTADYLSSAVRRRSLVVCAAAGMAVLASAHADRADDVVAIQQLMWVLLIGTAARQLQDLLAGRFFATFAKRSGLPAPLAYRDLFVAAAADLATLTMASVLLLRWAPARLRSDSLSLHLDLFRDQLQAVLRAGHATELPHALGQSASAVLVGVASIAFYASLLTPLKGAVWQRRTGDDLVAAADHALRHRRLHRAHRLLDAAQPKSPPPSAVSQVQGRLALAEDDPAAALRAAQAVVRLRHPSENLDEVRQREDALVLVAGWCRELVITPRPSVLTMARDARVRDSLMAHLTLNQIVAAGSAVTVPVLGEILDPEAWPLTFSAVAEWDGDLASAERLLPPSGRLTGVDLLFRNQMTRTWRQRDAVAAAGSVPGGQALVPEAVREADDAYGRDLLADLAATDPAARGDWPDWFRETTARALLIPVTRAATTGLDAALVHALLSACEEVAPGRADVAYLEVLRNAEVHRRGT